MAGKKGGQRLSRPAAVLQVQQMPGLREHEGLDVRQPVEQQRLPLMKANVAVLSSDCEYRLSDAARLFGPERPLAQGRQLVREERVGVSDGPVDGTWQRLLEKRACAGPAR